MSGDPGALDFGALARGADADQMAAGMTTIAQMLAAYRQELTRSGFGRQDALALTMQCGEAFWAEAFRRKPAPGAG